MTHWRHGHHPGALFGIECFISEEIGAIYLPGLEKVLYGTLWEYCALRQFYEQTYNPMQVSYYLKMYLQHPLLIERLTKVGFRDIVSDVVYRDGFSDALDETQTKTHRILRVQKEDVSFLLEKNATIHTNPQHPELIVAFRWRAVYKYYFYIIRGDRTECRPCGADGNAADRTL